MEPRDFF